MLEKKPSFPKAYTKLFKLDTPDTLVNSHLNQQSIICDLKTGARKSPLVPKFTNKIPVKTMKDVFEYGLNTARLYPCLGKRLSLNDPYSWLVYSEVDKKIMAIGSALVKTVKQRRNSENFVGIYGRNSPEVITNI
ncbi:unnamed protein product [Schistosoma turkestanicum]|nr:unnamed protein product [Schistosoma turkestanicum]